ncbi:MAG: sigma-54 dependent transcriptional regulator [Pseudomonadota bacterium]
MVGQPQPRDDVEVVLVDDDEDVLTAGRLLLAQAYGHVRAISHPKAIGPRGALPRVLLLDMNFGPGQTTGEQGLHWLARLLKHDPDEVAIMVTAHGDLGTAVDAMKCGACDFVTKPWQNDQLLATVEAGVTLARTRARAGGSAGGRNAPESPAVDAPKIIGDSMAMRRVLELVALAAPVDANVLVLGENGTGKDLVARAVHQASRRVDGPFVAVDLGAVPDTLFESELFGHKRGAFTDARSDRTGRLVSASGGTLFLDEIGNVPLASQAKLLGALEQRRVTPVGATASEPFDVRLIAATNLPPEKLADPQTFRQDLLFRLNTIEIVLPPLRERPEDVPSLVRHYLPYYEERYEKPSREVDDAVLEALATHPWPGNVRALRHAVERAVIMAGGAAYRLEDFALPATARAVATAAASSGSTPLDQELNLDALERRAVSAALNKHGFNISRAAKELGLTRAALYRRMEKHGL